MEPLTNCWVHPANSPPPVRIWARFKHETIAPLRNRVAVSIRQHDGRPIHSARALALQPLLPNQLARLQFKALRHSRIVVNVNMTIVNYPRTNPLLRLRM